MRLSPEENVFIKTTPIGTGRSVSLYLVKQKSEGDTKHDGSDAGQTYYRDMLRTRSETAY